MSISSSQQSRLPPMARIYDMMHQGGRRPPYGQAHNMRAGQISYYSQNAPIVTSPLMTRSSISHVRRSSRNPRAPPTGSSSAESNIARSRSFAHAPISAVFLRPSSRLARHPGDAPVSAPADSFASSEELAVKCVDVNFDVVIPINDSLIGIPFSPCSFKSPMIEASESSASTAECEAL